MNEIRIPYQSREQPIGEVLELNLAFKAIQDPQERCLVDEIVFDAACEPGLETVGDLLDQLQAIGVVGCRERVDKVRVAMGEKTLDQVDGEAKVEAATRSAMAAQPLMDGQGRRFQNCHADGCDQAPFDESGCRSAPLTVSGGVPPIASWPVPTITFPKSPPVS